MVKITQTVDWNGTKVPVYHMETIDFGRLLSQEPAEVEKLVRCCQEEGYFYLDLQGIDGRRMLEDEQETLALMHRFFAQPLEAKNEFGLVSAHLGYEPVGSRNGVLKDTKDGYEMIKVRTKAVHFAVGIPHPPGDRSTPGHGAKFPHHQVSRDEIQRSYPHVPAVLKNSTDMKVLENTIASSNIACKTILSALSTGLGLTGAARFENTHRNDRPSTTTLAMMHYIPSNPTTDKNVGHQKHTDISSLTLLFSASFSLFATSSSAR